MKKYSLVFMLLLISQSFVLAQHGGFWSSSSGEGANYSKVLEVKDIQLDLLKSNPPQLEITATGTVPSGGWSKAKLVPHVYVVPPADGIYDFDFVAVPPTGIVILPLLPITAFHVLKDIPGNLKGVRIHASLNSMEELLAPEKALTFLSSKKVECSLGSFDKAIAFSYKNTLLVVVSGKLGRSCDWVEIVRSPLSIYPPQFNVNFCKPSGFCPEQLKPYTKGQIFTGASYAKITVVGKNQKKDISVIPIKATDFSNDGIELKSRLSKELKLTPSVLEQSFYILILFSDKEETAVGFSSKMSYKEALEDAIKQLDLTPEYPDQLFDIQVIKSGVLIGGIAGERTLYVKVQKSKINPSLLLKD